MCVVTTTPIHEHINGVDAYIIGLYSESSFEDILLCLSYEKKTGGWKINYKHRDIFRTAEICQCLFSLKSQVNEIIKTFS